MPTFSFKNTVLKTTKVVLLLGFFIAAIVFSARVMSPDIASAANDFELGTLDQPPGVEEFNTAAGLDPDQSPLPFFISRMIRLISLLAGLWSFVNIIVAGYTYITGQGNANSHEKVRNLVTMSVLGLFLIVLSYMVGGLIGLIFFGDASFILEPTI
jgi:TRAP-type C4-dicarboxylate transport system permease small subunit